MVEEEEGVQGGWRVERGAWCLLRTETSNISSSFAGSPESGNSGIDCPSSSTIRCFTEEFQWFLIELSVRPGRRRAISAHRLPRAQQDRKGGYEERDDDDAEEERCCNRRKGRGGVVCGRLINT